MAAYIFLDPDGSRGVGLTVLVAAPTGITYAHQCVGYATETRAIEGFAVPVGGENAAAPLLSFFKRAFRGNPPPTDATWTEERIAHLRHIVGEIPFWLTHPGSHDDRRVCLELDADRLDQLTEAWVPVHTPYGPGILVCNNCD